MTLARLLRRTTPTRGQSYGLPEEKIRTKEVKVEWSCKVNPTTAEFSDVPNVEGKVLHANQLAHAFGRMSPCIRQDDSRRKIATKVTSHRTATPGLFTMKEKGTIHNMTALPRPIVAETGNKQLVKILALGDVEGYSPSCWVVNENGEIDLESVSRFTVIDPEFLPPNAQRFFELTAKGQSRSKY